MHEGCDDGVHPNLANALTIGYCPVHVAVQRAAAMFRFTLVCLGI